MDIYKVNKNEKSMLSKTTNDVLITNSDNHLNNYKRICDSLVKSLQDELAFYKDQHVILRKEISEIAQINNQTAENISNSPDLVNYKQISDEIISNLKGQIKILEEEKRAIKTLWETTAKTVDNLESEISEYRQYKKYPDAIPEIRRQYETVIKECQAKILLLNAELQNQRTANRTLVENYKIMEQKFKTIEKKHQDALANQFQHLEQIQKSEITLTTAKAQIAEITRDKTDLENRLCKSKTTLKLHMDRESNALIKIQEVLQVAETAISEKNTALLREQEIKDECDYLASTIRHVLEEASDKVEKDMNEVKKNYMKKIKNLETTIMKMKTSYENLVTRTNTSNIHAKNLEHKLQKTIQNNVTLDSELQKASKAIIEMEIKLQTFENLMEHEKEATKICDNQAQELREFLETNKTIKKKWKKMCEEITLKLNGEIDELKKQNTQLRHENNSLKTKLKCLMDNKNTFKVYTSKNFGLTEPK